MKKIARIYSKHGVYSGDVYVMPNGYYAVIQRGCTPCYYCDEIKEVTNYIASGANYMLNVIKPLKSAAKLFA